MKTKQTIRRSFLSIAAMSLILFTACENGGETKSVERVDPPKQIISKEQAAVLFQEYTNSRVPCAVAAQDSAAQEAFVPARYTEFDFKVIKKYIEYIDQEAKAAKKEIKTLRVYYAVYPPDSEKDKNKTTVFMVPSTDFDGKNMAFEVHREGESTEAVAIPWDFGTGIKQMGMNVQQDQRQFAGFTLKPFSHYVGSTYSNGSLVLNDGTTAPPPYN